MSEVELGLRTLAAAGFQIDRGAFDFLQLAARNYDVHLLIEQILKDVAGVRPPVPVINRELVETAALKIANASIMQHSPIETNCMTTDKPFAKDVSARLEVLNDPSHKIGSRGSIEDFASYFRDRFHLLSRTLNERMEVRGASDISSALKLNGGSARFICMIRGKRDRKTHVLLEVEDEEEQAVILVQKEDRTNFEVARSVPMDQVVYVEAKLGHRKMFICTKIILPDVPERRPAKSAEPVCAALLSDIHIGSKTFMKDVFQHLVTWLSCPSQDSSHRELANRIKYVIIAGDIVDGVGIYPNQEAELEIPDVYKQYQFAAQYIEQIPDYIEVILIPGNHDPTRQSLPQPQVASEFAGPIYQARRVHSLGNPAEVSLHGVRFLLYHGRSLDDIITSVPGMTFQTPEAAMEFMLRCRHLAPEYGKRTPIAPETRDHLVIQNVPDVFHVGHIHVNGSKRYRGTTIVNSGTWQQKTEYQRRMGLEPTPGLLPIIDLQTLEITQVSFME